MHHSKARRTADATRRNWIAFLMPALPHRKNGALVGPTPQVGGSHRTYKHAYHSHVSWMALGPLPALLTPLRCLPVTAPKPSKPHEGRTPAMPIHAPAFQRAPPTFIPAKPQLARGARGKGSGRRQRSSRGRGRLSNPSISNRQLPPRGPAQPAHRPPDDRREHEEGQGRPRAERATEGT